MNPDTNENTVSTPVAPTPPVPELSYGQKAVGITFNPSGDPDVSKVKDLCAQIIDLITAPYQNAKQTPEQYALFTHAVREVQSAQMWAVKALTYKF